MKYMIATITLMISTTANAVAIDWNAGTFINRQDDPTGYNWTSDYSIGVWTDGTYLVEAISDWDVAGDEAGLPQFLTYPSSLLSNSPGLYIGPVSQKLRRVDGRKFKFQSVTTRASSQWTDGYFDPEYVVGFDFTLDWQDGSARFDPLMRRSFEFREKASSFVLSTTHTGFRYAGDIAGCFRFSCFDEFGFGVFSDAQNFGYTLSYEVDLVAIPAPAGLVSILLGIGGLLTVTRTRKIRNAEKAS